MISLHLESYVSTVEITQKEFIVPMTEELADLYSDPEMGNSIRSLGYESIRPQMATCEITNDFSSIKNLTLPEFPLDSLREFVMEALECAVVVNQVANRDPIGGTNQDLFVPLIKLLDKLLMAGVLSNEDISRMLIMIHPQTWDENFQASGVDEHRKGILDMKIHEDVKLELCKLIHHLCDVQVRHRLESIVSFAYGYMGDLQSDQLRRYIEIKQSDMPSAVAAKKTKEFRCPPREQMNTILSFKSIEDEEELEELAFNYASFAQQAQRDHMNLKALILVNFSKLLMMTCRVEPPQMCFNVWQYDCALDVKIRLGMLDEAIPEIHASRINQDKKLKEYGFDVEGLQMLMENRLFLLYTRLHYVEEADELFKNLKKSKDSNFANYDGLGFRHASTLYSAQRHSESIELFKKHKNF